MYTLTSNLIKGFRFVCLGEGASIRHTFTIPNCENETKQFTCKETRSDFSKQITLTLSRERKQYSPKYFLPNIFLSSTCLLRHTFFSPLSAEFVCFDDEVFGDGLLNDEAAGPCEEDEVGEITAICRENGAWETIRNGCILLPIHDLLQQSEVTLVSCYVTTEGGAE